MDYIECEDDEWNPSKGQTLEGRNYQGGRKRGREKESNRRRLPETKSDAQALKRIERELTEIRRILMATWQDVKDAAAAADAVDNRVLAYLAEVQAKLAAMPTTDPVEMQAVVDALTSKAAELESAIADKTPVPVETPPTDVPVE